MPYTADADAIHVRLADESICIEPPPAKDGCLDVPAVLGDCEIPAWTQCIPATASVGKRPLAEILAEHDLHFRVEGARSGLIGDKIEAEKTAKKLGIPVVPGSDGGVGPDDDAIAIPRGSAFRCW